MLELKPLLCTILLCLLTGLAAIGLLGGPVSDCVQLDEQDAELSVAAAFAIALLVWVLPLKAVHFRAVIAALGLAMAGALLFQPTKMRMFRADVLGCATPRSPSAKVVIPGKAEMTWRAPSPPSLEADRSLDLSPA